MIDDNDDIDYIPTQPGIIVAKKTHILAVI